MKKQKTPEQFYLPSPPTDKEKYSYYGRHHRWAFIYLFLAALPILLGYVFVMLKTVWTYPLLLLLVIIVPPIFVNLFLRVTSHRYKLSDHIEQLATLDKSNLPSVDVFLPTCGEDMRVLENTFYHVAQLEYNGELKVYVLDDANLKEVKQLSNKYGFKYRVRRNRGFLKKAGNLIAAFNASKGDFIAVFDADFAPRKDFLYEALPYMNDPTVGVVQTAQYFDNSKNVNWIGRYAGTLQEMFFRWIEPARDAYDAAICAGTNLIYRRKAVRKAGGFAQVPIGEDVHSGIKLWNAHYKTRYVPLALAKGLCPDDFKSITNQQYRWCRSSMLLMFNDSKMFWSAPFNLKQRIAFLAALFYYLSSALYLITLPLPTMIMLWLHPEEISWIHYLPVVPGLIAVLFIFPILARGWNLGVYRQCMLNSFCHVLAVFDSLRGRLADWVPSGAATTKKVGVPQRAKRVAITWIVLVQIGMWGGIAYAVIVTQNPVAFIAPAVLTALQLYLLFPLIGVIIKSNR